MASVRVVLRTQKLDPQGQAPLYIRIIKDRRTKFISLGLRIDPTKWSEKDKRVKHTHPNYQRTNHYIAQKVAEAEDIAMEMETKSKFVHPKAIKQRIMGKSYENFFAFAQKHLDLLEKTAKIGTYRRYRAVVQKLKDFWGPNELLMGDITVQFLREYEEYMLNKLGNAINTVNANFRAIRKLINDAVADDLLPPEQNPFVRFKLKSEPTDRGYITEEELARLEKLELKEGSMLWTHRNIYVFATYAGGIRISDLLQLRWSNLKEGHIVIRMQKTGATRSIKLPSKAMEIIDLYREDKKGEDDFIFPFMKKNVDMDDPKSLFNKISSATAYTNKDLRRLSEMAGINRRFSMHTSRHTFATRALQKGMRIEYVSKIMGHTQIRTTQIYTKIIDRELDKAMEVFDE